VGVRGGGGGGGGVWGPGGGGAGRLRVGGRCVRCLRGRRLRERRAGWRRREQRRKQADGELRGARQAPDTGHGRPWDSGAAGSRRGGKDMEASSALSARGRPRRQNALPIQGGRPAPRGPPGSGKNASRRRRAPPRAARALRPARASGPGNPARAAPMGRGRHAALRCGRNAALRCVRPDPLAMGLQGSRCTERSRNRPRRCA
jgi:hypothetical protein